MPDLKSLPAALATAVGPEAPWGRDGLKDGLPVTSQNLHLGRWAGHHQGMDESGHEKSRRRVGALQGRRGRSGRGRPLEGVAWGQEPQGSAEGAVGGIRPSLMKNSA